MNAVRVFRYGFKVGVQDFSNNWNLITWVGGWSLRIVTQGIFFALLGLLVQSPERLQFLLVGQAVVVGASNTTWAMYGTTLERQDGTYPLLVIAPSSATPALAGRTVVWLLSGIASSLVAFVVLAATFNMSFPWPEVSLLPPLVALTCAGSYCMALFIGSVLARVPQAGTLFINVISAGLIAICGVSVPVDFWPIWLQALAQIIPLTHGLQAIRLTLDGAAAGQVLLSLCYLAVLSVFWLVVGVFSLDRFTNAGRGDGTIEFIT